MTKKEKHMIAKQYLQRGRDIQRQITQLYEKRSEFFDRATSTTMAISPVKVQTSHSGQGLENAIIGMVDTEEKINNKIAELQMQQWNLQREIQQVRGLPYNQMLYKIFIERKSYDVARKEVNLKPFRVSITVSFCCGMLLMHLPTATRKYLIIQTIQHRTTNNCYMAVI